MKTKEPLTYLLGQTMKLVRHKLMAKFKENNLELTLEQFVVLLYIHENSASTQQDLANHFLRDKSIVTRQINTLIDLGYVMRTQDDEDKRKKNLQLTKAGIEMLELLKAKSVEVSTELLDGISQEELTNFEHVISKIQHNTGFKECLSCC
ncbi:MarR family winged helix-turn-helix transcriptional regulator [Draconibacterium halophilum]|uniref:MarR family transcriptional regulator n=1 Tax=Draconibacterium halophilum TaxID=2706887 RepID=A0A6C0RDE2_9BACT|nr:MarR family transcriptional regulator [Draconibacterium halophilum]QIA07161.1 MarR family transcriptional regulator [Draconibacterium halophilum]